jgi:mono/diheme cytochrome c family protein
MATEGDGGTGDRTFTCRLRHATTYGSDVDIITSGIPGTDMPSFPPPLTERNIRLTATYVQSLSRFVRRVRGRATPSAVAALYQSNGCASCHIVDGRGGMPRPRADQHRRPGAVRA